VRERWREISGGGDVKGRERETLFGMVALIFFDFIAQCLHGDG